MNMNKALYWIALAAVAIGLNSEYQRGGFACLHDLARCAQSRMAGLTNRAHEAVVAASVLTGHWRLTSSQPSMTVEAAQLEQQFAQKQADLARAMAEHQAELVRAQARLVRAQAVLERARLGQMQVLETTDFKMIDGGNRRLLTVCPKTGRHIHVEAPNMADIDMDLPAIDVSTQF